jgi:hypothetical protein
LRSVITQGPAQAEHQQQRGDDIQRITPLRQTRRDGNNHYTYFDKKLLTHQAVIPYIEIALIAVIIISAILVIRAKPRKR